MWFLLYPVIVFWLGFQFVSESFFPVDHSLCSRITFPFLMEFSAISIYKTWFAFLSIMLFHLMYNKLLPDKLALLNGGWSLLSLSPTLSEAASCSSLLDVTAHPLFFYLSVGRGKGYPHTSPGESLVLSLFKDLASPTSFQDLLMAILGFTSPGLFSSPMLLLSSRSVVSDSLQPHELKLGRLPCPSPSPRACSDSCPLSRWYHLTISSSVARFSSCLQSFPASGSFPMSGLWASGGQSIGT